MGDVATSSVLAGPRGVDQSKPSVFQVYSELEFVLYNPRRFERAMLMSSVFKRATENMTRNFRALRMRVRCSVALFSLAVSYHSRRLIDG